MGLKHIPNIDTTTSAADDNPFEPVAKMLNVTLVGYPTCSTEARG